MKRVNYSENYQVEVNKNKKEIASSFHKSLSEISQIKNKLDEGRIVFDYGGRPLRGKPSDIIRVVSQTKRKNSLEACSKNIILNSMLSLEKTSPFSSHAFLDLFDKKDTSGWKTKTRAESHEILRLVKASLGSGVCYQIFSQTFG